MRVLLTIQSGPQTGSELELHEGKVALVGRASWAELSVPHDQRMSGRHFTLECSEGACTLRDQKSSNGTFVNGKRVTDAVLHNGDQILAGTTMITVFMDPTIPPPAPPPPGEDRMQEQTLRALKPPAAKGPKPTPAKTGAVAPAAALGAVERLVLTVTSDPMKGRRLVVQPGKTALVGRASWAEMPFPDDKRLSGRHFTVECTAEGGVLRDPGSTNGTLVNGHLVKEVALRHGDVVVAGTTNFKVEFYRVGEKMPSTEAEIDLDSEIRFGGLPGRIGVAAPLAPAPVPGPPEAVEPPPDSGILEDHLLYFLRHTPEPLFALLDAARDPKVLAGLKESEVLHQSLYEGPKGEELAPWAPYLAFLPPQTKFLHRLVADSWGKSWGVFLTSKQPFAEVRKHFRKFLFVNLPDGKEVYFRFYDPRVLRVFLATCNAQQMKEFFGPVSAYYSETADRDTVLQFTAGQRGVRKALLAVFTESPQALEYARSGMWLREEIEIPG